MSKAHERRLSALEAAASSQGDGVIFTDIERCERLTCLFRHAEQHGHTPESTRITEILERARQRKQQAGQVSHEHSA